MRSVRREFLLRFARSLPAVLAGSSGRAAFSNLIPGGLIPDGQDLGRFGGLPLSVAQPTGFFRIEKLVKRWVLVDPEGRPFWMLSVDAVNYGIGGKITVDLLKVKYGERDPQAKFGQHALDRLRSWGFNALGPYAAPM